MSMKSFALSIISILLIAACTPANRNDSPFPSISQSAHDKLNSRVSCNSAQRDIKVLEDERASVGRQIIAGVRSVFPIAVVAGILSNDYNDRVEVATGQYNADIEKKIKEIRTTCGV